MIASDETMISQHAANNGRTLRREFQSALCIVHSAFFEGHSAQCVEHTTPTIDWRRIKMGGRRYARGQVVLPDPGSRLKRVAFGNRDRPDEIVQSGSQFSNLTWNDGLPSEMSDSITRVVLLSPELLRHFRAISSIQPLLSFVQANKAFL
jgi:hypothetical protein